MSYRYEVWHKWWGFKKGFVSVSYLLNSPLSFQQQNNGVGMGARHYPLKTTILYIAYVTISPTSRWSWTRVKQEKTDWFWDGSRGLDSQYRLVALVWQYWHFCCLGEQSQFFIYDLRFNCVLVKYSIMITCLRINKDLGYYYQKVSIA